MNYQEAFLNIKKFPRIFWVIISATFINQVGNMAFVFLMLYTTEHLGFSLSQGANLFAVVSASMLLSGILSGNLIDYFGAFRIMIFSVFMNGIILLILSFLHNYYTMMGMCFGWGFFYGVYRPASQTTVSYLTIDGLHKITFSVYRLIINLGMSMGPAIGGYLAMHSFSLIFISNGIVNILAGIILLSNYIKLAVDPIVKKRKILSLKFIASDPMLRLFLIGIIPIAMVFYQHESTLPIYLKQNLEFPISFYGWLFTINTLMIVFLELLLNIATINWPYRVNFILGSVFISLGFAGIYFASKMWHIIMLTVIWTIGEMILFPAASSYIAEIAPNERRGSYMSLFNVSINFGLFIGPWMGAIIMQHMGGSFLWPICGMFGIFSCVIFFFLQKSKNIKI